jgi:hypothetical protein
MFAFGMCLPMLKFQIFRDRRRIKMKLKVFFTISLALCASHVSAQWKGKAWSHVWAYGVANANLFQSYSSDAISNAVFRYGPDTNWHTADAGIDFSIGSDPGAVTSFASQGPYFFAVLTSRADHITYRTSNDGANWNEFTGGAIGVDDSDLFSYYRHFQIGPYFARSTDSGVTWDSVANFYGLYFASIGNCDLAAASNGLWHSTNHGSTWALVAYPLSPPVTFAVVDTVVFAGSSTGNPGLARSNDSGATWTQIPFPHAVTALATDGKHLWAGTMDSGVYISTDTGQHWRNVSDGLKYYLQVTAMAVYDTMMVVATVSPGTQNYWEAWRPISEMVDTTQSAVTEALKSDLALSIFPNPASGAATISLTGAPSANVEIFDVLGREVASFSVAGSYEWQMSALPAGAYIVRAEVGGSVLSRRVAKE